MESSKRLLKEAERLSRIGKPDESLGENSAIPDFFRQDEFLNKWNKIPDKMAFKIGEVADLVGVKQYVLRYWETEFDELRPKKGPNNQRMYSRKNIEIALMIQHLLHVERFSIEGARKFMRKRKEERRSLKKQETNLKRFEESLRSAQSLQRKIHDFKIRLDSYFRLDA